MWKELTKNIAIQITYELKYIDPKALNVTQYNGFDFSFNCVHYIRLIMTLPVIQKNGARSLQVLLARKTIYNSEWN